MGGPQVVQALVHLLAGEFEEITLTPGKFYYYYYYYKKLFAYLELYRIHPFQTVDSFVTYTPSLYVDGTVSSKKDCLKSLFDCLVILYLQRSYKQHSQWINIAYRWKYGQYRW